MWFRNLLDSLKPERSGTPIQKVRRGAPRRRPSPCRLAVESLEDRSVPASLSVGNATLLEGNAGTTNAVVTVSLSAPTNKTVTVNYNTADGTARAGSDYNAVSGLLTFAPGQTTKTILVPVIGDRVAELDETYFVKLQSAKNATIANGQGVVTIVDDDSQARISISNAWAAVPPGYVGNTFMTFTVSLAAAYDQTVTVNFTTQDGTAIAGQDYLATSGTLTFAPGETTKTITVEIFGNETNATQYNREFYVNLSGASFNARINVGQGYGSIMSVWGNPPEPIPDGGTY